MRTRRLWVGYGLLLVVGVPVLFGVACPAAPGVVPIGGGGLKPSGGDGGGDGGGDNGGGDNGGDDGGTGGVLTVNFLNSTTDTGLIQVALYASPDPDISTFELFLNNNLQPIGGQTVVALTAGGTATTTIPCALAKTVGAAVSPGVGSVILTPSDLEGPLRDPTNFTCPATILFTVFKTDDNPANFTNTRIRSTVSTTTQQDSGG